MIIADVSQYQGVIDWVAYGKQNKAVIVRAHNGYRADNYWISNRNGARANTYVRGFYQYLPANVDAGTAARSFATTVGPLLPGEFLILDLEEGIGDQRARRKAWYDAIPFVVKWTYSGLAFTQANLPQVNVEWIAAYRKTEPTYPHRLWQFTNAGVFAGISKPCDASLYNGSLSSLMALVGIEIGSGPVTVKEDDIVASVDDLKAVVKPVQDSVDKMDSVAFRLIGGQAVWAVHAGVGREYLSLALYRGQRIVDVPATSTLWSLPTIGVGLGETYRKTGTDGVYSLTNGNLVYLSADVYAGDGAPLIIDLPADNDLWKLLL